MNCQTTCDFQYIILNNIPLIDVRAPIEYEKGAFPNTTNLPIMDNMERHTIGTTYKKQGHDTAVALGYHLVSGENKRKKVSAWSQFIHTHPNAMLYCFRGGQRSRISQEWIQSETKQPILRLEGGYKAFRNYLLQNLDPNNHTYTPLRLGGHTGSGKTRLLQKLESNFWAPSEQEHAPSSIRFLDLEGIAHHRGSAFGNHIDPQPTQINFENTLAYKLIQLQHQGIQHLILEDEGRNVGRCFFPQALAAFWNQKNLVILEASLEERVHITYQEYVLEAQTHYIHAFGNELGLNNWLNYILESLAKMKKRLGGLAYQELVKTVELAYIQQQKTGSTDGHTQWIYTLLANYYDPMYAYQMEKNTDNIIFRGNATAVTDYFMNYSTK